MIRALVAALVLVLAGCGVVPRPSMDTAGADSFADDVRTARTLGEEFWTQQFRRLGRTYQPIEAFIPYAGDSGPDFVQLELQADCYAGGTLSALVGSGVLTAEAGDEEELLLSLAAAGDPTDDWFDPNAHGMAEQRQLAFAKGYRGGVDAC
ncbi:hypothetical protein [Nonomuraea aridisoli]|uniref:hypothetical protein n=1 Tax=Nonomuraea aridisoli TaxID=2070368 RepID=UPI001F2BDDF4|nr:hypothetical protein [Nonomuraea aridisoli]